MRILHLLNHTRRLNGHVHVAIDLACAQAEMGHEVAVASEGGDFDRLLAEFGVATYRVGHQRSIVGVARGLGALWPLLRRFRPDVVHAHMMTSAVLAFPLCAFGRTRLVTTVHNEFEKSAILMGLGRRVIAVSAAVARSMQARGIAGSRIDVVLNGTIGAARLRGQDRTPRPLTTPAIVFVGGLHPRKGLDDLFAAFALVHARNPAARLYVVGDGPTRPDYVAAVARSPCAEAVSFEGGQDNPYPWMAGADIFVLPSHADPAPLVLSEAREAGCAIVATRVDGIPELLEHGRAGLLVPPRDPAALAEALLSLIEAPETLRLWRERSQVGIERMRIERVARETLAVYAAARGEQAPRATPVPAEPGRC
ncbi:glycosyl transferase [Methylobacterium tarhaniae]|uniref:Glycosyl transferase n=1 Tax=Methylobacterium tarhaniae TaxID=1187852 RepID=A0A0J6SDB1_9HYPH|nr:glycosyltransferase [Methylobacterium tarhaniae]KMO33195.1 glycosyl transferase [Methylobacterium tarhaniae]